MHNSIKAALAAVAGGTLLLGGAGTLAFWTDEATGGGSTFESGDLDLGTPTCDGWELEGAAFTNQLLVPGDELTQTCTFTVVATGEHLAATVDVETPTWTPANDLSDELSLDTDFELDEDPIVAFPVTVADEDEIVAALTVTFDGASATNDSKALTTALDGITLTATQTHDAS